MALSERAAAAAPLVGVLDLGKTHGKLLVIDGAGVLVNQQRWAHASCDGALGYRALDTAQTQRHIERALRALGPLREQLGRLIVSAHGAALAGLAADGTLAFPVPDYEWPGFDERPPGFAQQLDPFSDSLSPLLPRGLNLGVQLDWLARHAPQALDAAHTLLPHAQYWSWWLSGVVASEVSSLGCHSLLWQPADRRFAPWATARGWAGRFAPLRPAWDVLGPIRPELARCLGLRPDVAVHVGVHDSNACLAAYLQHWPAMTLVSSGTWVVVMAPGAPLQQLDPALDQLGNVSVRGDGVATARFMGGREIAALCAGADPGLADPARVLPLLARGWLALPSFEPQGGPFAGQAGRLQIDGRSLNLTEWARDLGPEDRATAAAVYAAQMTAHLVQSLRATGPVVLDGPLSHNPVAVAAVAALLPDREVHVSTDPVEGTARGAWRLTRWPSPQADPPQARKLRADAALAPELQHHFKRWKHQVSGASPPASICMNPKPSPEEIAAHVAAHAARRVRLPAGEPVAHYLQRAQDLVPALIETAQLPVAVVEAVLNKQRALRFDMVPVAEGAALAQKTWRGGQQFTVDFGGHRTGYLSFHLVSSEGIADSPVRLRLTFGEVPPDVAEPFEPYRGWLSAAWLPEEVLVIDDLPQQVRLARRHAFRYVKVEVLATSVRFGVRFEQLTAHAVTSARRPVAPLPAQVPAWIRRVDEIAQATLRDCLQTSFEDGPRRDRRLWVGDLRLQALANYVTFEANDVVKRCLYLFAGLPRCDGLVNACVFERPAPAYADTVSIDYAALYNVTLHEYVQATGDVATGHDLWPVATRQIEVLCQTLGDDDLFVDTGATWCFIDWSMELDRSTAVLGVLILAMRRTLALAELLGRAHEVAHLAALIERLVAAARSGLFDADLGVYVSGPKRQVSCASQAWMVLAGVPESPALAATALQRAMAMPQAIQPATPYLNHYLVEALLACGQRHEAESLIKRYWGAMADAGADTFWEVFDPAEPLSSPYGDIHINSYCHAWSCTPSHFFRHPTLGLGLDLRQA